MKTMIIALEGPDRHGKTTHAMMLCGDLTSTSWNNKKTATLVEFPSSGPFADLIKRMLKTGSALSYPNLFQFLQFVNKLLFQWFVLPRLKSVYDYVILGRWSMSTIAYGDATGANKWFSRLMYGLLMKPHRTIVLLGEQFKRRDGDKYDEDVALQQKVIKNYHMLVNDKKYDAIVVPNFGTKEEVNFLIKEALL